MTEATERVHITVPKDNLAALLERYQTDNPGQAVSSFLNEFGSQITPDWEVYTLRRDHSRIIPEALHEAVWRHYEALLAQKAKHPATQTAAWVRDQVRAQGKEVADDQISDAIIYRIVKQQRALRKVS